VAWKIKDLLKWTTCYLKEKGIEEPRLEAEILLARVLGKDRVYLYVNYEAPVNKAERDVFRNFIKRRVNREPVAYIVGYKEFMSLEFKITPDVLIPRADTELLVETAIDLAKTRTDVRICDVGTGSGAIAVSLAFYLPNAQVYAVDISGKALEVARENARRHNVRVHFYEGDLLLPLKGEGEFDLIVANLPYITEQEYNKLDCGIRNYEPAVALLAPGDGLDIYRCLVPQALDMLKSDGYILLEIAHDQKEKAIEMMQGFKEVEVIKDMDGRFRLLKACRRF